MGEQRLMGWDKEEMEPRYEIWDKELPECDFRQRNFHYREGFATATFTSTFTWVVTEATDICEGRVCFG